MFKVVLAFLDQMNISIFIWKYEAFQVEIITLLYNVCVFKNFTVLFVPQKGDI